MHGYGEKLKKLRGERTQAHVAESVGISVSALAMYEAERRVPRDKIKSALADYYGTTVQKIFFAEKGHVK